MGTASRRVAVGRTLLAVIPRLVLLLLLLTGSALADDRGDPAKPAPDRPEEAPEGQDPKPEEPRPKPEEPDKPKPKMRGEVEWWTLDVGLERAKKERRALILVYAGAQPDAFWEEISERVIANNKKTLEHYIAIEVPRPVPRAGIEILGGLQEEPVVAVGDFRGTILKRWDEKAPPPGNFRSNIRKVLARNQQLAAYFKKVEDQIAKSRYALKQKKYRECVQLFLETEKMELPPGSELVQTRTELRGEIDEVIDERRKKGQELEDKDDLVGAINEYEKIMNEFPLPDVREELRKRVRDLWAKLRGYGG